MCGICGILYIKSCEHIIEHQLGSSIYSLKHRGYDGCGVSINLPYNQTLSRRRMLSNKRLASYVGDGIQHASEGDDDVSDVKQPLRIYECKECSDISRHRVCGISHTRYKTKGDDKLGNIQPLFNKDKTIAMVHNGQVVLRENEQNNIDTPDDIVDSHIILKAFEEGFKQTGSIFKAVENVHNTVKGSYACVIMIQDLGLIGFRDLFGIRPLVFGTNNDNIDLQIFDEVKNIKGAIFASESVVLNDLGFKMIKDVHPGESIFVDLKGNVMYSNYYLMESNKLSPLTKKIHQEYKYTPCLFEYIYLADENSVIDGICVNRAREIMGELLIEEIRRYNDIDVICPIPNTPSQSTKNIAQLLKIPYIELLYTPISDKNNNNIHKKTHRTFILDTPEKREKAIKNKFRISIDYVLKCQNKVIALVDDSIVRGTTMRTVIKLVKDIIQPKKIIIISLAPPIKYKNIYGVDISNEHNLIASGRTYDEIARELGVDNIIYGNLQNITTALLHEANTHGITVSGYETSTFNKLK